MGRWWRPSGVWEGARNSMWQLENWNGKQGQPSCCMPSGGPRRKQRTLAPLALRPPHQLCSTSEQLDIEARIGGRVGSDVAGRPAPNADARGATRRGASRSALQQRSVGRRQQRAGPTAVAAHSGKGSARTWAGCQPCTQRSAQLRPPASRPRAAAAPAPGRAWLWRRVACTRDVPPPPGYGSLA